MPFLTACSASYSGAPTSGVRAERVLHHVEHLLVAGLSRSVARWSARPPIVGAYERPLSFTTMTSGLSGGGDVVQRLPAHAAGQRTVADDDRDVPILATQCERLGHAVGVGQRGRGVRVLDHVVLGLGLARIAGQATALAQQVEAVLPAGDDLVHVRLVAGVEQDAVLGRVEDPVQASVSSTTPRFGPRCPPVRDDLRHQEVADLGGQDASSRCGQLAQVDSGR